MQADHIVARQRLRRWGDVGLNLGGLARFDLFDASGFERQLPARGRGTTEFNAGGGDRAAIGNFQRYGGCLLALGGRAHKDVAPRQTEAWMAGEFKLEVGPGWGDRKSVV